MRQGRGIEINARCMGQLINWFGAEFAGGLQCQAPLLFRSFFFRFLRLYRAPFARRSYTFGSFKASCG